MMRIVVFETEKASVEACNSVPAVVTVPPSGVLVNFIQVFVLFKIKEGEEYIAILPLHKIVPVDQNGKLLSVSLFILPAS